LLPEGAVEDFLSELSRRRIPIVEGPDVIRWGYTNRGTFTIKEAFHIQQGADAAPQEDKWKKIWHHQF